MNMDDPRPITVLPEMEQHEIAKTFTPPMTEKEREHLAHEIEASRRVDPITVYEEKILDCW